MRRAPLLLAIAVAGCSREQAEGGLAAHAAALTERQTRIGTPQIFPSAGDPDEITVATGSGVVFTSWLDWCRLGCSSDLYATRLTVDGGRLDITSLPLKVGGFYEYGPSVAFVQNRFFTVWMDESGGEPLNYRWVELDGGLGPVTELVHETDYADFLVTSAEPSGALVVWFEQAVRALYVDATGRTEGNRDGGTFVGAVPYSPYASARPQTAWTGQDHLIAWRASYDAGVVAIWGTRVGRDGGDLVVRPPSLLYTTASDSGHVAVASDGTSHRVLFSAGNGIEGSTYDPATQTFGAPGHVLGPANVALIAAAGGTSGTLLAFTEALDAGARLSLVVLAPDGGQARQAVNIGSAFDRLGAVAVGRSFYVAWTDRAGAWGAWVDATGAMSTPESLARGASRQSSPSVVAADGGFLVAWLDERPDQPGVRLARVDALGVPELGEGALLMTGVYGSALRAGRSFNWLLMNRGSTLIGVRLTLGGALLDPVPVDLLTGGSFTTTAMVGDVLHVVSDTPTGHHLFRFDADGGALDLAPRALPLVFSTVGSGGRRALIADGITGPMQLFWVGDDGGLTDAGLYARSGLGTTGIFEGAGGALVVDHNFNVYPRQSPQLLVLRVWEDGGRDVTPTDLSFDSGITNTTLFAGHRAAATWNGHGWELFMGCDGLTSGDPGCRGRWFDVPEVGVPTPRGVLTLPMTSAARLPAGQWIGAGVIRDVAPDVLNERVVLTALSEASPGSVCLQASDCASNVCEDGVCCVTSCGGLTADCQACSPGDGVCRPLPAQTVCRGAATTCDVAEVCDGVSVACPADAVVCDGGTPLDGGAPTDGGTLTDGGVVSPPHELRVQCSCGALGGPVSLALVALLLTRSRRSSLRARAR